VWDVVGTLPYMDAIDLRNPHTGALRRVSWGAPKLVSYIGPAREEDTYGEGYVGE